MPQRDLEKILSDRMDAQNMLREATYELERVLEDFDGTVMEAIRLGLVKPNFATSYEFKARTRVQR
jgi:hypothetical protein